jgi:LysM repeat protein
MPPRSQIATARFLAPLALAVCALAVLVVIAVSIGGGDSSNGASAPSETASQTTGQTTTAPQRRQPAVYTVKPLDTLGGISDETGVPVETLEQLNPELDPQALVVGQKIKLRE